MNRKNGLNKQLLARIKIYEYLTIAEILESLSILNIYLRNVEKPFRAGDLSRISLLRI